MGQWHTPRRLSIVIRLLKLDYKLEFIYQYELNRKWTESTKFKYWLRNFEERAQKYLNKKLVDLIPHNTIRNKEYVERQMSKSKKRSKEFDPSIYDEASREDLILLIETFKDYFNMDDVPEKDLNNKKSEIIEQLRKKKMKLSGKKINITLACKILEISKCVYYRRKDGVGYRIRKDSKVDNLIYVSRVNEVFENHHGCIGSEKISAVLKLKYKVFISQMTVLKIMNNSHLFPNAVPKVGKKFREEKNTILDKPYLINDKVLLDAKPGEVVSGDFAILKSKKFGHLHVHLMVDVAYGSILALDVSDNQTSSVVLKQLKSLHNAKIFNTDHGRQYFDSKVQNYCKEHGIQQSMGAVAKSTDNRWVEYTIGRIRQEWLNNFDVENLSIHDIRFQLNRYVNYWNKYRPIKKLGFLSPSEFISKKFSYNNRIDYLI